MKKREFKAPIVFAVVAFIFCVFNLLAVHFNWSFPVSDSPYHFANMLILAFSAVLMTAYPYHLLRPSGREIWTYAQAKSAVFGFCALPFLLLMVYIYQQYGEEWRPLAVNNVWEFCMAYVICCWGFMLFLLTKAYELKNQQE